MSESQLHLLFHLCMTGRATDQEREECLRLLAMPGNEEAGKRVLRNWLDNARDVQDSEQMVESADRIFRSIVEVDKASRRKKIGAARINRIHFLKRSWVRYAAAIIVIAGVATYLWKDNISEPTAALPVKAHNAKAEILPGTSKALLTLANGSTIVLDSGGKGRIASEGGCVITKSSGHLFYTSAENVNNPIGYNTLSTPRGGQYQLTLEDGTKVWLNASSSIHFPFVFNGKERNVEITGEAYFEVAKNASRPFHVKVKDMTVEVLGTHFNVMAYDDENSVNTTLLEGLVKVVSSEKSELLKPGQQSTFDKASAAISIADANIEKAMAWKNGMFMFRRDDIKTIMRQIGRWYDVDISYSPGIPAKLYSGTISKYADVAEVLNILELGGIQFKTEGNRITIF